MPRAGGPVERRACQLIEFQLGRQELEKATLLRLDFQIGRRHFRAQNVGCFA